MVMGVFSDIDTNQQIVLIKATITINLTVSKKKGGCLH